MANIGAGTSVSASGFNALFTRLETLRQKHKAAMDAAGSGQANLNTAFATNIAVVGNKPVPSNVQQIKTDLEKLSSSAYIASSFAAQISVPSTGALLAATNFNVCDTTITQVEAICANYNKYSQYTQYNQYSQYSQYNQYSEYSQYGQYGNYYNYSQYYQYSNAIYS